MSLGLSSREFLGSGGGVPGKLIGGAIITAAISSMRPFSVIKNNQVGFRRRMGKVDRVPEPRLSDNGISRIMDKVKPSRTGDPIPKMLGPGLHWMMPLGHSIEVVTIQPQNADLGVVTLDRINKENNKKTQFDLHAEIQYRVSPWGFNPYRAVDEVDDRERAVKRICRGALGKAALDIENIQRADPDILTNQVNQHALDQLLKIGVELLHVTGIEDTRSFGEMVQPKDGFDGTPPYLLVNENEQPESGGADLHIVS